MRLHDILSLKTTQNNEDHFYNRGISQGKEDAAVTLYVTHLVHQLLAEFTSSNPQPQQEKRIYV